MLLAAEEAIGRCEDLARIVHDVVGVVHLLRAPPEYDVSHSEPRWKDRIFVSLPDRVDGVGALRLAEGVIHESMHLELTLEEAHRPLVADVQGTMPSPWRNEPRPYQGVVHGLFVFACLTRFLRETLHSYGGGEALHVRARLDEIREQVAAIDCKALLAALTPVGSDLVANWRELVLCESDLAYMSKCI